MPFIESYISWNVFTKLQFNKFLFLSFQIQILIQLHVGCGMITHDPLLSVWIRKGFKGSHSEDAQMLTHQHHKSSGPANCGRAHLPSSPHLHHLNHMGNVAWGICYSYGYESYVC